MTMSASDLPDGVKVGDVAPNFVLKGTDGKSYSLASLQDMKGAIIVFTCNHCPYSVKYEDRIIALHAKYLPLGYPVIAINPNDTVIVPEDSYDKMIERAKEKGFTFPYLIDPTQETAKAYGARRTPHVFVISKVKKNYIVQYIGAIDDEPQDAAKAEEKFVESAIDNLIAGKPVEPSFTKAIGCTIKWTKK
ncbi:MAG: thioredoxin family protein [Candidatus Kapabacteria bacterium]|nr:thioredoxin family protein [Candidatus Kapabacteria bacterium]